MTVKFDAPKAASARAREVFAARPEQLAGARDALLERISKLFTHHIDSGRARKYSHQEWELHFDVRISAGEGNDPALGTEIDKLRTKVLPSVDEPWLMEQIAQSTQASLYNTLKALNYYMNGGPSIEAPDNVGGHFVVKFAVKWQDQE